MEQNKIIIYQTEDGQTQIDVRMENETVWLTQAQMAELFQTDRTSIVRHINNIYKVEELDRESTCAKIAQVSAARNSTPVWRRRLPCSSILSPRTTRSATATNALPPRYSYG